MKASLPRTDARVQSFLKKTQTDLVWDGRETYMDDCVVAVAVAVVLQADNNQEKHTTSRHSFWGGF